MNNKSPNPNSEIATDDFIASRQHLAGFFIVIVIAVLIGVFINSRANAAASTVAATTAPSAAPSTLTHLLIYLPAALGDLAFLFYCWNGVHDRGMSLFKLARLKDGSSREWLIDALVVVPFIVVWELVAYAVAMSMNSGGSKAVDAMLPQSFVDVGAWIVLSCVAGFCEELIFRCYLQRQLSAMFGNVWIAIVGQAICFGVVHAYQGWRPVVVIFVLGLLYGTLARLRPSIRANVFSHAFSDVWEGWLKFIILR